MIQHVFHKINKPIKHNKMQKCFAPVIEHLPYIINQARMKTIDTPIWNSPLKKKE